MQFFQKNFFLLAVVLISFNLSANDEVDFLYKGRVEVMENNNALLISPGASVTFTFTGKSEIDFSDHHLINEFKRIMLFPL